MIFTCIVIVGIMHVNFMNCCMFKGMILHYFVKVFVMEMVIWIWKIFKMNFKYFQSSYNHFHHNNFHKVVLNMPLNIQQFIINMCDAHNNNTCNKLFHTENLHFDITFQDLRTSLWEFYF